jgi:signal transduction histidine kinase
VAAAGLPRTLAPDYPLSSMSQAAGRRPVYLLAPAAADVGRALPFADSDPVVLRDVDELAGLAPGILVLHPDLPAEQVLLAVRRVAHSGGAWLPLLIQTAADGKAPWGVPLSLGWPSPPDELARWAEGAADAEVLELRHVLARVARARHDLNNPLTSAMAETQLALMDATDPELRAGLQTIEEQLRRMRDLIASLRGMRPPD